MCFGHQLIATKSSKMLFGRQLMAPTWHAHIFFSSLPWSMYIAPFSSPRYHLQLGQVGWVITQLDGSWLMLQKPCTTTVSSCPVMPCHCCRITSCLYAYAMLRCLSLARWMPSARGHARHRLAINGAAASGPWSVADARARPLCLDEGPWATTTAPHQGVQ